MSAIPAVLGFIILLCASIATTVSSLGLIFIASQFDRSGTCVVIGAVIGVISGGLWWLAFATAPFHLSIVLVAS